MKKRILIVEDEPAMRMGLQDNLEFEGYDVSVAQDGEEGLKTVRESTFDLVILDIMMPKFSGYDVCKYMRQQGDQTPVIFLSAKAEEIDKVLGLELGADDFIAKPFSVRELMARIKAILRRTESIQPVQKEQSEAVVGRLTANFQTYTASSQGAEIKMSHKEFEILKYLLERKNQTVSRNDLLQDVWGYAEQPTTRTVDNFVMKLRQKIEENPNKPSIILTVHGIGYKLLMS
ncbi:MAG: response regulator transcription factor [Bacteroidota bacterium]